MEDENKFVYAVVVNHEAQYSIWPVTKDMPAGWEKTGKEGSKSDCLTYIEEVWTDMRPQSIRNQLSKMNDSG